VYHHSTTASIAWVAWFHNVPNAWFGLVSNTFVHIIMYFYFAVVVYDRRIRVIGHFVTYVQLIQFYCGMHLHPDLPLLQPLTPHLLSRFIAPFDNSGHYFCPAPPTFHSVVTSLTNFFYFSTELVVGITTFHFHPNAVVGSAFWVQYTTYFQGNACNDSYWGRSFVTIMYASYLLFFLVFHSVSNHHSFSLDSVDIFFNWNSMSASEYLLGDTALFRDLCILLDLT
jgi:hypothetical protein